MRTFYLSEIHQPPQFALTLFYHPAQYRRNFPSLFLRAPYQSATKQSNQMFNASNRAPPSRAFIRRRGLKIRRVPEGKEETWTEEDGREGGKGERTIFRFMNDRNLNCFSTYLPPPNSPTRSVPSRVGEVSLPPYKSQYPLVSAREEGGENGK